jgi:hypothetical protein
LNDITLLENRIALPLEASADDNKELQFQNAVLRPILKALNSKFIAITIEFIPKLSNIEDNSQRRLYVKDYFNKNPKTVSHLCGMTSSYFTNEEFKYYLENFNEINKRIKQMSIERIASNQ